ncbi:MAG: hypothetical protein IT379_35065 [Deltaproteobacteria bacterium]|nr:hypothetical protein [Deltaproteobacteria bacterium]
MASGPLSVVIPDDLRARLADEARRRRVKLSTVVRVLVAERVQEIDAAAELSAAEQWQRAQAWSTWQSVQDGERAEASSAEIASDFDRALARSRRRRE